MVLMLFGSVLAVLTYAAPLLASVCLIPVIREFGSVKAWLCWAVSAVLSVLLSPDKELAFYYAAVCYYPIIRRHFLKLKPTALRIMAKTLFFMVVEAVLYVFLYFVLKLEAVVKDLGSQGAVMLILFFSGMTVCHLIYDMGLAVCESFYENKLRPKLKFLGKQRH